MYQRSDKEVYNWLTCGGSNWEFSTTLKQNTLDMLKVWSLRLDSHHAAPVAWFRLVHFLLTSHMEHNKPQSSVIFVIF